MRRGTRSCRECRRRKIKCTWTSDAARVCQECSEHDRPCASQGAVNNASIGKRSNLKIRIGKLESIIERLSKSHPEKALEAISETDSSSSPSSRTTGPAQNNNIPGQEQLKGLKSPLLDLFDNEVLQRKNTYTAAPETSAIMSFVPEMSDRDKILSTIANESNVLDVLDIAGDWWIAWEDQYPGAKDLKARLTLRNSVSSQLADNDPVAVAAGLICIVMSLQQVRVGLDDHDLQLASTPAHLVEQITIAVDQVILSNESYTHSMMGVQLLILKAKQHADSNQLRKAWLRIRQAIQTAQKIELAKPMPGMSSAEILGRQRFMGSMFETDRFMSLLLGLPYALDENFTDKLAAEVIGDHPDVATRVRALRRITAVASGHVNDRNASSNSASVSVTESIQHTLTTAGMSLPFSWWDIQSHTTDLSDPILSHEYLLTQLWFYQTQALLQLPLMLKAASDPPFEPSRIICLDSCRSLITIFNTLRSNPVLSAYTCKCEDFQGLLAAIVLLIGLLHYAAQGSNPTGSSFEADMELVEITMDTFRYARQQQGGNIAKQGLHVLETLSAFLEDTDHENEEPRKATLFVPYFGTVSIEAGGIWKPRTTEAKRDNAADSNSVADKGVLPVVASEQDIFTPTLLGQAGPVALFPPFDVRNHLPDDGQKSQHSNGMTEATFDWDKILIGPELLQDWDFLPTFMTAPT